MNWSILNVSVPVHDLEKSKKFYQLIFPHQDKQETLYQNIFEKEESVYFGNKGLGLRLFKPMPDLKLNDKIQSRRSYVSILVDNILKIKYNLERKKIDFIFETSGDGVSFHSLYVQEPSLNLIHFVQDNNGFNKETNSWSMGLDWGVHHMNLESLDVRSSIDFFTNISEMIEGEWVAPKNKGDFSIDPSELAILPLSNNNRGLHVIKPDDGFGYRNNFAHNPSIGGHPAFTIKDLSSLKNRLDKNNILYSDAKVYAMPGFHQIYLYDINANMLEVNQAV